jgi:spore coat polysaccharide biosynthesis protein SpsF (cytidylyltransferase family)
MSIAIVVQASVNPGLVSPLTPLVGRPLLEHAVARLRRSGLRIIVVTSDGVGDDALEAAAAELNLCLYRGQPDPLARVLGAADAFGLTEVVCASAEQPAMDIDGVLRIVELRRRVHADHAVECGLPRGAAVEAVSVEALRRAQALVCDPYDREYVTAFVRRDARFTSMRAVAPGHLRRPGLRLVVTTAADLAFMNGVLAATVTPAPLAPLEEIIASAEAAVVRAERARLAARRGA